MSLSLAVSGQLAGKSNAKDPPPDGPHITAGSQRNLAASEASDDATADDDDDSDALLLR